jgi:uncharacterized metal-binding protein
VWGLGVQCRIWYPKGSAFLPHAHGEGCSLQGRGDVSELFELRELALAAARTEAAGYCKEPRVEEIMNFARRIGARRLGIASCIGLIREARILQEILEANGFEVDSVCCKVGSIDKEKIVY